MQYRKIETANLGRRGFLGLAGLGAAAAAMPAPLWAMAQDSYPTVRAKITEFVAQKKVANALAAIGRGSAAPEVIAAGTLALGDSNAVDIDTIYRVYSMTKPVTGMAAMILIGEGKMKLDQPISDFLPEFKDMTVLTDPANSLEAVPAKNAITVRHLLTHTAGLGYTIITKGPLLQAYLENGLAPGAVSKLELPGFPKPAPTPDFKTFSERLAKLPLIAEPGTKWSYSLGLDLMGRVIEVVSGMEFGAFLKARIFDPLKMNSSYFQVPKSEIPRLTTNYGLLFGSLIPIDPAADSVYLDAPAFPSGGGGMASTARDYDRFLHMLMNFGELDGERIMALETAKLGMSNLLPAGVDVSGTWIDQAGHGAGGRVGLGQQAGSFGWGGAAGTNAFVHTGLKLRATGMTQYMPADVLPFQRQFPEWVIADVLAQMGL
ncbi:serine hydrolase domain-containing protein [Sphingorhabdus arenilitoris]|uniref:Serine hydrolase domain-containing protein n=1 Tax=Sphingorhabdus arenilitoris TaxID=1490041 RepID=A0ABV8RFU5_9SPHN